MKSIFILVFLGTFFLSNLKMEAQTEVTFYTSKGDFTIMLYDSLAPITAGNFRSLVDSTFYDGIIFHRIIDNFVVQGGDPTGTGSGGPGYSIQDEFDPSLSNIVRSLSMANSGPNTGGSQFFINLKSNTFLDFDKSPFTSAHPVFGIVVKNWAVARNDIGRTPVDASDRPITPVVMDSLRVTPAGLSVKDHILTNQVHIYPNPLSDKSQIFINSSDENEAQLQVYNLLGALVFEQNLDLTVGNNSLPLKALSQKGLTAGRYQIVITSNGKSMSQALLIP